MLLCRFLGGNGPRNKANGLDPPAQGPNPFSMSHKARLSNVEMLTNPRMVDHLSKNSWDQLKASSVHTSFHNTVKMYISCVEYVYHLGHIISYDLQNDLDIQRCKRDFIRRGNGVLSRFGFCTPED